MEIKSEKIIMILLMIIFVTTPIGHTGEMHLRIPNFSQMNEDKRETSLHIGCGGENAKLITEDIDMGFAVTVVDISPEALDRQKDIDKGFSESGNVLPTYKCIDASYLEPLHGFMPNSYHKVTILNVLDSVVGDKYSKIIDNILTLIAEGGIIVATTDGDVYSESLLLLQQAEENKIEVKLLSSSENGKRAFYKIISKPKRTIGHKDRHTRIHL